MRSIQALGLAAVLVSTAQAEQLDSATGFSKSPCNQQPPGPAVLIDLPLYKEGHPGTRVIDYGRRMPADEFQPPLG